jgi:hypothetical protein
MPLALRVVLASALALAAVACGASSRNSKLGSGSDKCFDVDSDCSDSHQCCSDFCANRVCEPNPRSR